MISYRIMASIFLLLGSIVTKSQSIKISGRTAQADNTAIADATVTLRLFKDSSLVKGTATSQDGIFVLENLAAGEYMLSISHVNFEPYTNKLVVYNNDIALDNIVLAKKDISQLSTIVVQSQKPLFTRLADKLVLNVEGSIYEKGENGLRLFNIIPGVRFTGNDILFRGSEKVVVYVDNRKIPLAGDQLLSYLRAIPSESVKSYELKAVPGAENDAQNGGVIINIILKSQYRFGLSGNINSWYSYNSYNNISGSSLITYRKGKITLQGSINYWRHPAFYEDGIRQQFKPSGVYSLQTEKYVEKYNYYGYTIGVDYKITDRQTLGANFNTFANPRDFSNNVNTNISFFTTPEASLPDSSLQTGKTGLFKYTNKMANMFYRLKSDSLGSKLDIGYSYVYYNMDDPEAMETKYFNSAQTEYRNRDSLFTLNNGKSNIHVGNIDWEKYFSGSLVFSAGGKYTTTKTDYTMDYRYGLNAQSPLDSLRSNRFLYNEKILALYGTLSKSFKYWQIKAGMRAEQTHYDGRSVTSLQKIARNRWDFFPSVYINRKIGEAHSFTLSYARRIDRPGFRQLNPFTSYTSHNNIREGNPNLLPYFSNNIQIEYLLKNKSSFTAGYQNTSGAIASNIWNDGDIIISKDENISNSHNLFVSFYIPVKITSWWEFNTNLTLRNTTMDIQATPAIKRSKFSQNLWASSMFTLPAKYYVEVTGFYNGNQFWGIYDAHNTGRIDINMKKSFLKDRLTARVELVDPFNIFRWGYNINTGDLVRDVVRKKVAWNRSAGIGITYNFSGGKKQTGRENIDAGGNEVRRRL